MTHEPLTDTDTATPAGPGRIGPDRRTVLKVGAWAAPVIAVAVAAPAASASQLWDLALESPQAGGYAFVFTSGLTQRVAVDSPDQVLLRNAGTAEYAGTGASLTISVDPRLWTASRLSTNSTDLGAPIIGQSGELTTYTWPLAVPLAAGESVRLMADMTFVAGYPNDNIDDPGPLGCLWQIAASDAAGNNAYSFGVGDPEDASPFGGVVTAEFEQIVRDGQSFGYRPTSATVTSVGPNPIVSGEQVIVRADARVSEALEIGAIAVDGIADASAVTISTESDVWNRRNVYLTLTRDLPGGSVLSFTVAGTDSTLATPPAGIVQGEVSYYPTDRINSDDERAKELSYVRDPSVP